MPKGEIQNRDRDEAEDLSGIPLAGFGELPEDLSDERGDLDTYGLKPAEQLLPDMASAQVSRADADLTGVGSPRIDYSVRSTFDTRPINAREFNLWFTADTASEPPPALTIDVFRSCFFVPDGYVALVRGVTVLLSPPITPEFNNYDGLLAVAVNGARVDPPDVPIGPVNGNSVLSQTDTPFQTNQEILTHVLADQNSTVGLFLDVGSAAFDSANLQVGFRGVLLLKTGVPAQFQAANEAGRARAAVTASASDLKNIASSEGLIANKRRKVPFANVPILRK